MSDLVFLVSWTMLTAPQFELASRLVGVYKVNHMTKSVTIENRNYIKGRSQQQ